VIEDEIAVGEPTFSLTSEPPPTAIEVVGESARRISWLAGSDASKG
jgi:hypothetical protein